MSFVGSFIAYAQFTHLILSISIAYGALYAMVYCVQRCNNGILCFYLFIYVLFFIACVCVFSVSAGMALFHAAEWRILKVGLQICLYFKKMLRKSLLTNMWL